MTAFQYDPPIEFAGVGARASIGASATNSPSNDGSYIYSEDGHYYAFDCQPDSGLRLNGKSFWGSRKVAKVLGPSNGTHWFRVQATTGEVYALPSSLP